MNLREKILGLSDRVIEKVDTPEWDAGGVPFVHVRTLSIRERMAVDAKIKRAREKGSNEDSFIAIAASEIICNEHGERIFQDADVAALMERSSPVMTRIVDEALKLAKLKVTDDDAKDAEKNS